MWDEIDNSTLPTSPEGQWDDILEEWDNILSVQGTEDFNSSDGIYLGKLACLVFNDYTKWATVQDVVEFVMTWRLGWPHAHDPAFTKLDQILQRHRPDFIFLVGDKPTQRNGQGS